MVYKDHRRNQMSEAPEEEHDPDAPHDGPEDLCYDMLRGAVVAIESHCLFTKTFPSLREYLSYGDMARRVPVNSTTKSRRMERLGEACEALNWILSDERSASRGFTFCEACEHTGADHFHVRGVLTSVFTVWFGRFPNTAKMLIAYDRLSTDAHDAKMVLHG